MDPRPTARRSARRRARWLALALLTALAVPTGAAVAEGGRLGAIPGGGPRELLPNLRLHLSGFFLEPLPGGAARLRIGSTAVNVGEGPFELRGFRETTDDETMLVKQRVQSEDGSKRNHATGAEMRFEGDSHVHWHLQRFIRLQLYRRTAPGDILGLRKLGFCIIDEELRRPDLPNASPIRHFYGQTGCGDPQSLRLKPGISVGWADIYPATFVLQWIRLPADFPPGRYRVCGMVDSEEEFRETRDDDNWVWHDMRIDVAAGTVEVLRKGRDDCRP